MLKHAAALACLALACLALPVAAEERIWTFYWKGSGGYAIRGAFSYNRDDLTGPLVKGTQLSCFEIFGYHLGDPIGQWGLNQWTTDTTWVFHFEPGQSRLLAYGDHGIGMPQAWNMGGAGNDCGADGFGFNIGNAAQDICIDNTLIRESQVPPPNPIPAQPAQTHQFSAAGCYGEVLLSLLD